MIDSFNSELYIPPEHHNRDSRGRFIKGSIPFTKGKKWEEYLSENKRKKILENLKKGRSAGGYAEGLLRRKKVVAIKNGKITEFDSLTTASQKMGIGLSLICQCCKKNHKNIKSFFYTAKTFNFFYESDCEIWRELI